MGQTIDIRVLEMLASKVCHDLISPISAVSNGVEFLAEMGADAGDEVTDLIKTSAQQASAKLQCYRMAYGLGGADTSIKLEDVHKTFALMIEQDDKIHQKWDPHAPLGPEDRPAGLCKMLMCALILGTECLPRGGDITVTSDGNDGITITANGDNASLFGRAGDALALKLDYSEVDPRMVHPYMCGLLAKHHGYDLKVKSQETGLISLSLVKL